MSQKMFTSALPAFHSAFVPYKSVAGFAGRHGFQQGKPEINVCCHTRFLLVHSLLRLQKYSNYQEKTNDSKIIFSHFKLLIFNPLIQITHFYDRSLRKPLSAHGKGCCKRFCKHRYCKKLFLFFQHRKHILG